jgi:glycosyltransferase involved in cell wall biosynthesis
MKTVLSFIDWYLPGYKAGGILKSFANQVANLEKDYKFKIITRNMDYCETGPYATVESDKWSKLDGNVEVYYVSASNINFRNFKRLVFETNFDVMYVHGIYSLWFSILPVYLARKKKAKRIVVAVHGMLGKHAISIKPVRKKVFIFFAKIFSFYKDVIFHVANPDEANDVETVIEPNARLIIAQIMPSNNVSEMKKWNPRVKEKGKLRLLSVTRIAPEKNIKLAIEILGKCINGEIVYDIYGPVYDQKYWKECQNLIAGLPGNITVNYKGSIRNELVMEAMGNYHFLFFPTTGENFCHAILESFMAATPVIISNKTPWQNLGDKMAGWEIPLDRIDIFVKKINDAVNFDQGYYNELSQHTLEFVKEFATESSLAQNKLLFE